ncbi:MAG: arginase family protein [Myxococcales bacterium]|nr:arginase family protein [Myxococcales bacterium]MCB9522555.1 arginase family protein [Myxococcales bacterium]
MSDPLAGFDPDGPADFDGPFGLPHGLDQAAVVVIPAPWDGTASFHRGTADGPAAVLEASQQVDLHHAIYGDAIWRAGVAAEPADPRFDGWRAVADAARDPEAINPVSAAIDAHLQARVAARLAAGQIPAVLGGEHSVALGGLRAALAREPALGVLHIDAHADLRVAYEGFEFSHASVFDHFLREAGPQARLVSVGLRDVGRAEVARIQAEDRVRAFFDHDLAAAKLAGTGFAELADRVVGDLPATVWISVDIDGLDPSLCPTTGTPVPGGLSWHEITHLLRAVARSGRRVLGFDLCEVGPGPWDANVGARLLYELAGTALHSTALQSAALHSRGEAP